VSDQFGEEGWKGGVSLVSAGSQVPVLVVLLVEEPSPSLVAVDRERLEGFHQQIRTKYSSKLSLISLAVNLYNRVFRRQFFRSSSMRMGSGLFNDDNSFGGASFSMPGGMPGMSRARRQSTRQSPPPAPPPQAGPSTSQPSEITRPFKVSLEDLYNGAVKRLKVGRRLLSGTMEEKVLEIEVLPGWKVGTKIRFPHAGNEQQGGAEAQDLVFVVEEKPHAVYTREGNDLVYHMKIPLVTALAGGEGKRALETLDGRKLQVPVPTGVVKPGQITDIPGEGMPIRKDGSVKTKGNLRVIWDVDFPDRLTTAQKEGIRKVLG
jgi:DnaJ family protein B protein 4